MREGMLLPYIHPAGNRIGLYLIAEIRCIEVIGPRSMGGVPKGKLRLEIMDK
jgi:hypothetical protein